MTEDGHNPDGTPDQLVFQDPTTRFASISPPPQKQEAPGVEAEMEPRPDIGEHSYRGTGRLVGRRALVTGGDSGIGAATAVAFAREGADVALTYLPDEEHDARHVAGIIEDCGRKAVLVPGDLHDRAFCADVVDRAAEALGGLDILVNNAGQQTFSESLEEITDDQLTATFDLNILAMFRVTRRALRHLPPGSAIINTTSVQGFKPSPILVDYASTKAAIGAFSKALAQQLAPRGIRVNAVAPGPVWTALQVSGGQPQEKIPHFGKQVPLGRAGQPVELAPAYVFLASSESSYVVGETLHVNGGTPSP